MRMTTTSQNLLMLWHRCETVAIGNGVGCRETEKVLSDAIQRRLFSPLSVMYWYETSLLNDFLFTVIAWRKLWKVYGLLACWLVTNNSCETTWKLLVPNCDWFIDISTCCVCLCSIVNESGASIYSASEVAQRELPNYDISLRGAGMINVFIECSVFCLCPLCQQQ